MSPSTVRRDVPRLYENVNETVLMPQVPRMLSRLYQVSVSNQQDRLPIDSKKLTAVVRRVLCAEKVASAEISVALLDDATIQQINLEYLNHDYPPDVLSFILDVDGGIDPASATARGAGKILSGEILLGVEEAQRGGTRYNWPAEHELLLYLVHGLLHLCGYDDTTPKERKIMRQREQEVLAEWGLKPPYLRRTPPGIVLPSVKKAPAKKSPVKKSRTRKTQKISTSKVSRRGGKAS